MKNSLLNRPLGLSILSAFALANGLFAIALGAALNLFPGEMSELFATTPHSALPSGASGIYGPLGFTASTGELVSGIFGALCSAWAIGAYRLRSWAWPLGVGLAITTVATFAIGLLLSGSAELLGVVGAAITLGYLMRPKVKALFGR